MAGDIMKVEEVISEVAKLCRNFHAKEVFYDFKNVVNELML